MDMDMDTKLETIMYPFLKVMYQYQSEHKIKNMCVANANYAYTFLKQHFPTIKAVAVMCCVNNDTYSSVFVHLVLMIDTKIFDPSYELYEIEDKHIAYFNTIKMIQDFLNSNRKIKQNTANLKHQFANFLKFVECADFFNKGGSIPSDELEYHNYYNNQKEYVEGLFTVV